MCRIPSPRHYTSILHTSKVLADVFLPVDKPRCFFARSKQLLPLEQFCLNLQCETSRLRSPCTISLISHYVEADPFEHHFLVVQATVKHLATKRSVHCYFRVERILDSFFLNSSLSAPPKLSTKDIVTISSRKSDDKLWKPSSRLLEQVTALAEKPDLTLRTFVKFLFVMPLCLGDYQPVEQSFWLCRSVLHFMKERCDLDRSSTLATVEEVGTKWSFSLEEERFVHATISEVYLRRFPDLIRSESNEADEVADACLEVAKQEVLRLSTAHEGLEEELKILREEVARLEAEEKAIKGRISSLAKGTAGEELERASENLSDVGKERNRLEESIREAFSNFERIAAKDRASALRHLDYASRQSAIRRRRLHRTPSVARLHLF